MKLGQLVRRVVTNRVSLVLILTHLFLLLYVYWERQDRSDVPFHFHYESPLFKILFQLDLPALWISALVNYALDSIIPNSDAYIWIGIIKVALLIVCTSLQWGIIGFVIWKVHQLSCTNHTETL